jgi:hypothetical protein
VHDHGQGASSAEESAPEAVQLVDAAFGKLEVAGLVVAGNPRFYMHTKQGDRLALFSLPKNTPRHRLFDAKLWQVNLPTIRRLVRAAEQIRHGPDK